MSAEIMYNSPPTDKLTSGILGSGRISFFSKILLWTGFSLSGTAAVDSFFLNPRVIGFSDFPANIFCCWLLILVKAVLTARPPLAA